MKRTIERENTKAKDFTKDRLLTKKEANEVLRVGRDKLNAIFNLESFPAIKIEKSYYVFESDLYEWLHRHAGKKVYLW